MSNPNKLMGFHPFLPRIEAFLFLSTKEYKRSTPQKDSFIAPVQLQTAQKMKLKNLMPTGAASSDDGSPKILTF